MRSVPIPAQDHGIHEQVIDASHLIYRFDSRMPSHPVKIFHPERARFTRSNAITHFEMSLYTHSLLTVYDFELGMKWSRYPRFLILHKRSAGSCSIYEHENHVTSGCTSRARVRIKSTLVLLPVKQYQTVFCGVTSRMTCTRHTCHRDALQRATSTNPLYCKAHDSSLVQSRCINK